MALECPNEGWPLVPGKCAEPGGRAGSTAESGRKVSQDRLQGRVAEVSAPGQTDLSGEGERLARCFSKNSFRCAVCGAEREDCFLGSEFYDIGVLHGVRPGIVAVNVRYCKDNPECVEKANNWEVRR